MTMPRLLMAGVCVLALGCTPKPSEPVRADKALHDALAACTATHGYDPDGPALPERALAPGEEAWRACAREAVMTTIVPDSSVPELYRRLIAEDERMTASVAAGTMTRAERRSRLEAALERIRAAETVAAEERRARLMRDMQDQMNQQRAQDDINRITTQAAQMQRMMIRR